MMGFVLSFRMETRKTLNTFVVFFPFTFPTPEGRKEGWELARKAAAGEGQAGLKRRQRVVIQAWQALTEDGWMGAGTD